MKSKRDILVFTVTAVVCAVLLVVANRAVGSSDEKEASEQTIYRAEIIEITGREREEYSDDINIYFRALLKSGESWGEEVEGVQSISSLMPNQDEVEAGDRVLLLQNNWDEQHTYYFEEFYRTDILIILACAFMVLLLIFGRFKGFATIISLAYTCLAVFWVFIPSVLSGHNIYLWSVLVCVFTVSMTLLCVNGANKKSAAAALGCFAGIVASASLVLFSSGLLHLTGIVNSESVYLLNISEENPIDLRAIVFAAIIIGAMGAIMDVAVNIAASLHEISVKIGGGDKKTLFVSGMTIGRDIMGTMANTLVLAYIGSSLSVVVLLAAYTTSGMHLFNREMIVTEVLQALAGSIGILLTIPLTSFVSACLFSKKSPDAEVQDDYSDSLDAMISEDAANKDGGTDVAR